MLWACKMCLLHQLFYLLNVLRAYIKFNYPTWKLIYPPSLALHQFKEIYTLHITHISKNHTQP